MRWLSLLFVVAPLTAAAETVIDRGTYRIELSTPSRGRVVFANGETMGITWDQGKIVKLDGVDTSRHRLPPHVEDDRFAGAILVARDLASVIDAQPVIRVEKLFTEPPLVLIRQGTEEYLERFGLVRGSSPDHRAHVCLLGQRCELAIEGPDGHGIAIFAWDKVVQRPTVIAKPRRAWKEIVPGRIVRMRTDLVECERALAAADQHAALIHLRDAIDAADDIVTSLPMSHASAIHFEVLLDDARDVLARDAIRAEHVAALRVALAKLRASLPP